LREAAEILPSPAGAREVAAAVTGFASCNELAWITGAALRCQGLAADDAGTLQAAIDACGRRVTHLRAQSGWQSLTPQRVAMVDLVAEGLSNLQMGKRLYVSPRTVQTHLAHVFAKLHITSRAPLAAETARHRG
jgi:DNA-binding CsgD family transcriptional regulator